MTGEAGATRPARTGWIIFAALAALYLASLAPRVTFWDAGEFIAAIESWGIPHPPGTPLYVALGRAVRVLVGWPSAAVVVNTLSAVCTAAACALGGRLLARRGVTPAAAIAAGICGGCTTSVWLSATEAEVYSASLLLSALMLAAAASAAGAAAAGDDAGALKRHALLVYLFALAAPLHPSALVAGPAAIWLASDDGTHPRTWGRERRLALGLLVVSLVAAGALATGRVMLALAAGAAIAALVVATATWPRGAPRRIGAGRALFALALGASPLLIMLLRARFDPTVNQGAPDSWQALGDEVARRQYEVQGLWPRQAPAWIQLANLFQYADWQFALGLAPESTASIPRLLVSLAFVALGVVGARAHRRRDERSFRALLALLLSGSLGVAVYLNLKAGPSIGWGILPDSTPHEARERDYFFVLAFWTWGLWAGVGAVALIRSRVGSRRTRGAAIAGLALAALPAALNWRAMNRRREPDASAASLLATALLESAPPNGVLVVWGDNDSYPLWEAQGARGVRRDVTVVTSPLLGAAWYRDELRRRWAIDPGPLAAEPAMVAHTVRSATVTLDRPQLTSQPMIPSPRPVAIAVTVPAEVRARVGGQWKLCGLAWIDPSARCSFALADSIDRFLRDHPIGRFTDNTVRTMIEPLRCPLLASRAAPDSAAADSLAGACNAR